MSLNTMQTGNFLKGVAIVAVLINHYINHFSELRSGGFANTVVLVFFFLSGYGIFTSLTKKATGGVFRLEQVAKFYLRRAIRIFPLFWIAYFAQGIIAPSDYSIVSFLGFQSEGHYWFISSILQCYIFAPFLVMLVVANRYAALLAVTILFGISVVLTDQSPITESVFNLFHFAKAPYLGIFFSHTYIFFLGMIFCTLILDEPTNERKSEEYRRFHNFAFVLLGSSALFYVLLEKYWLNLPLSGGILLLLCTCSYAVYNAIPANFPPLSIVHFLGRHSYPVYLFHMSYYLILERLGLLSQGGWTGAFVLLLFSPLFISVALLLEELSSWITFKSENLLHLSKVSRV